MTEASKKLGDHTNPEPDLANSTSDRDSTHSECASSKLGGDSTTVGIPETAEPSRLSRIETLWSIVYQAHDSQEERAASAQANLLRRYAGAIRSYLLGAVRNADLADELFQDFALRFVNGDFKSADPAKGKFRAFVKTILFRMVADHFRKKRRNKERSLDEQNALEPSDDGLDRPEQRMDQLFLVSWRDEVLKQTWDALEDYELGGGGPYHTVLTIRVESPALDSAELAEAITRELGKPIKPGAARVLVHRSREKFAQLLIDQIANSLVDPGDEAIEAELIDLRLIDYCRDALSSRKR